VLLAIGGRLFREYTQSGGKLDERLLKELDSWRGEVETAVTTITAGRYGFDIEGGLNAFFATVGLKMS
jgi:hypothetical protein